jgi:hypothetical protein
MSYLIFAIIFIALFLTGILLSWLIGQLTCKKSNLMGVSIYEGFLWSFPIWLVFLLLHLDYTSPYVLPIFQDTLNSEVLGKIYAMLLITCVVTARLFHTSDVGICVPSKDESKAFEEALAKELKTKQAAKENPPSK